MTALTEFILARVAEREILAQEASVRNGAEWRTTDLGRMSGIEGTGDPGHPRALAVDDRTLWDDEGALGMFPETAEHIAANDPARILAECEAVREIVGRIARYQDEGPSDYLDGYLAATRHALIFLAMSHSDHEDWREEW